jgi:hypothetical protein
MNTPQKTTFAQWFWFLLQTALIGLFVLVSIGVRVAMINIYSQRFPGAQFPWITHLVLFTGPLHLETIYATLVFVVTTLITANILMKGHQRSAFMAQSPITLLWLSLAYLALLCFVFLLCFMKSDTGLYSSGNEPPSPIPEPSIPPSYWLAASLVYLVAMLVIVFLIQKKRKNVFTTAA